LKIIAEVSANHLGRLERALEIIDAAKDAGADAVKFQLYDPAKIAPEGLVIQDGPWQGRNARELYEEAHTPAGWFSTLFAYARSNEIEPFSSVFDLKGLELLESLRCARYKIASFELVDLDLISHVTRAGKPMILSTGMATLAEISAAAYAARGCQDLTLLKCTSGYPAPPEEANLAAGAALGEYTSVNWGYSDHTVSAGVCAAAAALGATMLEAHLTLKRSDGGPDAAFSYEPAEFKAMVQACRDAQAAIGSVRYGPTASEKAQLPLRGRTKA
jgi:sialic acid synthase SpsE